ncbi:MAG: serine hydrolase [Pseudomonadota bacterium]
MKNSLCFIILMLTMSGCRHGVEISGQGSVSAETPDRSCTAAESPCRFDINGAYQETYTATPANGWLFDAWERCQSASGNACAFDIDAETVEEFADAEIPGVVARFRRPIDPLFRDNVGGFVLPAGNAPQHLSWLLDELRDSSTSETEIREHFDSTYIESRSIAAIQQDINTLRTSVSDPEITDLIGVTPVLASAVVNPRGTNNPGFNIFLISRYGDGGGITSMSFTTGWPRGGSNVIPEVANRNFMQLGEAFAGAAADTRMLVAQIESDQCRAIYTKEARTAIPIASVYKYWVLATLTEEIVAGRISESAMVGLDPQLFEQSNAFINDQPAGTQLPIADLASLMMGNSDNTATDHLQVLLGRALLEARLRPLGHRNEELMTPFLLNRDVAQLFGVLNTELANSFARGSEEEQLAIYENSIEPLGSPVFTGVRNFDALYEGSWAATAFDVCGVIASLRRFDNQSAAFALMDQAAGANTALLSVRTRWDRVWFKSGGIGNDEGGSMTTSGAWLFESDDKGAYVVVLAAGNPDQSSVNQSLLFGVAARAEELLFNR